MRYSFDNALSRGPSVVIGWLGLLTLAIVAVAALVLSLLRVGGINGEEGRLGFVEDTWQAVLRLLDPGTFSGDAGWVTRTVMLLITLTGVFLVGSLIGLIANAVDQRIEALRKGRSAVLEDDHTLILGWSERVPAIVRELIIANESRKRAAVVILADVDKSEMEDQLRDEIDDFKTTRLVCRSGSTSSLADLDLVNVSGARSAIVIGGNDAAAVKAVLAVGATPSGQAPPVVAEITEPDVARSLKSLFPDQVSIVSSDSVVAELTAQACRQRGLSQVFRELLDFDGDEIYFAPFPQLVGSTYGRAQLSFDTCSLMGVYTADGTVVLNPPADRVIAAGEELIGVASDDSMFLANAFAPPAKVLEPRDAGDEATANRLILVGWSRFGPRVVAELDEFLGPETTLEIIIDPDLVTEAEVRDAIEPRNMRIEVTQHSGGPEEVAALAARKAFHEVIVLGRRDEISREDADARTLMTLVAFRQLVRSGSMGDVRVVAEILEQQHVPLALATGADDFIVSDELTSLMIAQLSERASLSQVFDDLFDPQGCTIEVIPATRYGATAATCFADVVASASSVGHSAIGYRRASDGVVVVNPAKRTPLTISEADGIVVLR